MGSNRDRTHKTEKSPSGCNAKRIGMKSNKEAPAFGYGPIPEVKRGRGAPSKYRDVVRKLAGKDMYVDCGSFAEIEGLRRCARNMGYRARRRGSRVWVLTK